MLSTGEEIRSPQRSSRSGPILAKMPCTIVGVTPLRTELTPPLKVAHTLQRVLYQLGAWSGCH